MPGSAHRDTPSEDGDEAVSDRIADRLLADLTAVPSRSRSTAADSPDPHLETVADVVFLPRLRLPIVPAPQRLYVGALGSGWCELTDRQDTVVLGTPPIKIDQRHRFRLPEGVVRWRFSGLPEPAAQTLVVVTRRTGDSGCATWVLVVALPRLLAILRAARPDLHLVIAPDWPPVLGCPDT
jgi:hypothetical protein